MEVSIDFGTTSGSRQVQMGMELDFQQNKYDPSPQAQRGAVCPGIFYFPWS